MIRFFGLDGEMTSADLSEGGHLCQIGLAARVNGNELDVYSSVIGPRSEDGAEVQRDPKAMAVHGIPWSAIVSASPPWVVDAYTLGWLRGHGAEADNRGRTVVVGWGVGTFDMPFVRATLPRTAALISRRYVDLNAVCFALGGLHAGGPKMNGWKRMSKRYAEESLQKKRVTGGWHDAGYDAAAALESFDYLRAAIARGGKQ